MNASVADILRGAGFAPVCPGYPGQVRDKETQAGRHAPAAPAAPAQKCKGENENAKPSSLDAAKVRARLLELAESEYLDVALVRALPESELTATGEHCADAEREQPGRGRELARQYLHMLATSAMMREGRLPPDYDTPAMCRHCGPVWLPRSQVECLDVVDGWPRALGCPWCFMKLPEGLRIPRPRVSCAQCQHYQPDSVNPAQGMGRCGAGVPRVTWPHASRACATFKPKDRAS